VAAAAGARGADRASERPAQEKEEKKEVGLTCRVEIEGQQF